jgi:hypothetical protein
MVAFANVLKFALGVTASTDARPYKGARGHSATVGDEPGGVLFNIRIGMVVSIYALV